MVEKYYTRDQLLSLLDSPEISSEFREKIKAALNDGSQSAIESLGTAGLTTQPAQSVQISRGKFGQS